MTHLEITCPHCSAHGHVAVPPVGAVMIGHCPRCGEMMAVFSGAALPLDKEIVLHGNREERREHLLGVMGTFLEYRVEIILDKIEQEGLPEADTKDIAHLNEWKRLFNRLQENPKPGQATDESISAEELEHFRQTELPMLDDADYFNSIFH